MLKYKKIGDSSMLNIMKSNKKVILFFTLCFILIFCFNFFRPIDLDLMWNYGFSKNVSDGLIMYKDFNMVITPFYPAITGLLMKIFSSNLIIFYLINTFYALLTLIIIYKLDKNIIIPFFIYFLLNSTPGYNLLVTLFLFLLIYLEKNNKSDYLIGLVLGLTFLTKTSIGVLLCLPSLYYLKDFKKIIKRIITFILINLIVIGYFYLNNGLFDYINYAFLGLLDFSNNNSNYNFITIITIIIIIYLIREYLKTKDIEILYIIGFQIMSYPLFNIVHLLISIIPLIYYLLKKYSKINLLIIKVSPILIIIPIVFLIINYNTCSPTYDNNLFKYRYLEKEYRDDLEALDNYFNKNYNNVYFFLQEAYLYKLSLNIPINEYDLTLKGNMGYNGEERMIDKIKNLKKGSIIVTSNIFQEGQSSEKIYDYIKDNLTLISQFHKFKIYRID